MAKASDDSVASAQTKAAAMAAPSTPRDQAILDAAEALFAQRGFYGVTIRQITRRAGVDVALAGYYFGRKEDLIDAVFQRRAETLNSERLATLEAYLAEAGDSPTVEGVIEAFVRPLRRFAQSGESGWRHYLALVAQVNNSPEWGAKLMGRSFDATVRRLIEALKLAMPDAREEDLYWSYHFFSGALVLGFSETGRLDTLSGGLCRSDDRDALYDRMPVFIAGGFRRLCEPGD